MNVLLLYVLLLKATMTSFSGFAALPVVRHELVLQRRVLTDQQLETAIVASRTVPGPAGVFVVSVGYFVAGVPGAVAGWVAVCTPALLAIPLTWYMAKHARHRRPRSMMRAVVVASAALLLATVFPLAREVLTDPLPITIAVVSLAALLFTKVDPLWVLMTASVAGLLELL